MASPLQANLASLGITPGPISNGFTNPGMPMGNPTPDPAAFASVAGMIAPSQGAQPPVALPSPDSASAPSVPPEVAGGIPAQYVQPGQDPTPANVAAANAAAASPSPTPNPLTPAADSQAPAPAPSQGVLASSVPASDLADHEKNFYKDMIAAHVLIPGQQVKTSDIVKLQEIWLKNNMAPKPTIQEIDGQKYLINGQNTPIAIHPKATTTQQIQLQDGTIGRYITDSRSPDYLKFLPVYDPSTGKPLKAIVTGNAAISQGLEALAQPQAGAAPATSGGFLQGLFGKGSSTPTASPSPDPTPSPSPTPSPAAPSPGMDPASIKAAYKAGQIDRATAADLLRKQGFQ